MSINYDEAWNRATDEPAFSNGTEGHAWEGQWCARCLRDAPFRRGIAPQGCPLLLVALNGRTPAEWFEQPWRQVKGRPEGELAPVLGDTYHCIEFRAPGEGGSGEPRPRPEPSDMDGLFPRPGRRPRMYVPQAARDQVGAVEQSEVDAAVTA